MRLLLHQMVLGLAGVLLRGRRHHGGTMTRPVGVQGTTLTHMRWHMGIMWVLRGLVPIQWSHPGIALVI